MVADIGDIAIVPYNTERTCKIIKQEMAKIIKNGCRPLSMGGDHLVTYPVLQAMKVRMQSSPVLSPQKVKHLSVWH